MAQSGAWAGTSEARRGEQAQLRSMRLADGAQADMGTWARAEGEAQRAELAQLHGDLAWLAQRLWAAEHGRAEDAARLGARIDELATASKCAFSELGTGDPGLTVYCCSLCCLSGVCSKGVYGFMSRGLFVLQKTCRHGLSSLGHAGMPWRPCRQLRSKA